MDTVQAGLHPAIARDGSCNEFVVKTCISRSDDCWLHSPKENATERKPSLHKNSTCFRVFSHSKKGCQDTTENSLPHWLLIHTQLSMLNPPSRQYLENSVQGTLAWASFSMPGNSHSSLTSTGSLPWLPAGVYFSWQAVYFHTYLCSQSCNWLLPIKQCIFKYISPSANQFNVRLDYCPDLLQDLNNSSNMSIYYFYFVKLVQESLANMFRLWFNKSGSTDTEYG